MAERREPIPMIPRASVVGPLQARIIELAKDTDNIKLTDHALDRMEERDITDLEVFRVLRFGAIEGNPWIEPDTQEQGCKVVLRQKGARAIGVVTIVLVVDKLVVKTVEWED